MTRKKYIKPSIEVTDIKPPTLATTSQVDIYETPVKQTSNFTFGSKRASGSCWDDDDLEMEE